MKLVVALMLSMVTLWASTRHPTDAQARPRGEPAPEPAAAPAETQPAPPDSPAGTPDSPAGTPDSPTDTPDSPTGTPVSPAGTPVDAPATPSEIRVPTELELRREKARALVKRGQDLAGLRQFDEALAAFRAALQAYPAYPLAQYELGITLVETKDLAGAEANLRQAIAMAPDFARAHQALGEVLRRQKRYDDARLAYLEAVKYGPKDTIAWYGLAATLKAQKNEPEALWALEALLAASENTEAPVAVEARKEAAAMISRGVVAKAIEVVGAEPIVAEPVPAPEVPPTPGDASEPAVVATPGPMNRYEGDKAFAEQRYLDALSHYMAAWHILVPPPVKPEPIVEPVVSIEPTPAAELDTAPKGDPELAYRIGATYAVMNDNLPAIRWWKTALALDPSRELIARHLGILMSRVGQTTERPAQSAAHLMERAKALLLWGDAASAFALVRHRDDVGAGHLEAESRLRLGDYKHARQIFEELLAADPEDRLARAGLGEALLKLGETEPAGKAIETWMGDNKARPETFIVLRRGELEARLLAPYEPED